MLTRIEMDVMNGQLNFMKQMLALQERQTIALEAIAKQLSGVKYD